jgi:hypothetical protein
MPYIDANIVKSKQVVVTAVKSELRMANLSGQYFVVTDEGTNMNGLGNKNYLSLSITLFSKQGPLLVSHAFNCS